MYHCVTIFGYACYYTYLANIMKYCMEVDFHGALICHGEGDKQEIQGSGVHPSKNFGS